MGEVQLQPAPDNDLDERPNNLRRARPPDIEIAQNESRIPLWAEKTMKRGSTIGLRSIFARNKTGTNDKDNEGSSSRIGLNSAGIRASLADFGGWPYKLHSSRSEASLIGTVSVDSRPTPTDLFSPYRPQRGSSSTDKSQPVESLSGRAESTTWNPPPFFQVYPQAVKHATLPACNVSVEALARNSEARTSKLIHGPGIKFLERSNIRTKGDTLKKKHRMTGLRNSLEWTSKIFVLVTSGYLLQYAAEGTFNRVPEKVLQLTATSAAYASDLIAGRPWVLQVASATDANGTSFTDSKAHRSKFSAKDNTRVSNMLLVFESPETMDKWLAVLRREIEFHGGKKKTSETGGVEADDAISGMGSQSTERTIVVEDRGRFSYVVTQDFSYTRDNVLSDCTGNDSFAVSPPRRFSAFSTETASPTASMVSSDGQRLDNLRDSSSSHRFSYVSSGQRTMVTSAGSSPACSPTRASFSSQREELQPLPSVPEVRLRPNAAAIASRRQSMQALISSSLEAPIEQISRPYANSTPGFGHENEQLSAQSVPNFSVPHTVSKRFSLNASATSGINHPQTLDYERGSKTSRKTPPTALLMSRPLSIVIDQPSPRSPCSPNSLTRSVDSCQSPPLESEIAAAVSDNSPEQNTSNRTRLNQSFGDEYGQGIPSPGIDIAAAGMDNPRADENIPRPASTVGSYSPRHRLSGVLVNKDSFHKRSGLQSENRSLQCSTGEWKPVLADNASPVSQSLCSPKRSVPSLRPTLPVYSQEKEITARRSMPQLNEGPPLGPPPSRALPPIPRKPSRRMS